MADGTGTAVPVRGTGPGRTGPEGIGDRSRMRRNRDTHLIEWSGPEFGEASHCAVPVRRAT